MQSTSTGGSQACTRLLGLPSALQGICKRSGRASTSRQCTSVGAAQFISSTSRARLRESTHLWSKLPLPSIAPPARPPAPGPSESSWRRRGRARTRQRLRQARQRQQQPTQRQQQQRLRRASCRRRRQHRRRRPPRRQHCRRRSSSSCGRCTWKTSRRPCCRWVGRMHEC